MALSSNAGIIGGVVGLLVGIFVQITMARRKLTFARRKARKNDAQS